MFIRKKIFPIIVMTVIVHIIVRSLLDSSFAQGFADCNYAAVIKSDHVKH